MNVPTLRFPEFKGVWERKKVGELCDFIVPGRNKPTDFNGEIPWITTPDIEHNGIIVLSKKGLNISKEQAKKIGSKIVPKNSIIISCVGDLGLSAIAGKEIVINQQLHAFLPKEKIEYRFLLYQLNLQKKYMDMVATKTAVPYMNKDNCNSIPITFPTLPEQSRIANFLTAVDEKIQALKKKKGLLEAYKKGVMQRLFLSELGCEGLEDDRIMDSNDDEKNPRILKPKKSKFRQLRFKDENGKAFADWEVKKLGEICEIVGGGTPETNIKEYWQGDIQWFTPTEIKSYFVSKSSRTITHLGLRKSSAKLLPKGTILLTTRATIGEASIALEECTTNQGFQSLIVRENVHNIFVFNWIKENKYELTKRANGSTFPEISKSEIEQIAISIPSLSEQTRIANFLSSIDEKIKHNDVQIEKMGVWKKGLLQKMFV